MSEYDLNVLRIIRAVRSEAPVTRSQLPHLTNLSSGLVSKLTGALVKCGLINELRDDAVSRGRPRTYLSINANGGIVAGASIETDSSLSVWFVDLAGRERFACRVPLVSPETLEDLALSLRDSIREAIARSPFEASDILRLGLTMPAVVNADTGIVYFMTTLPERPVPVGEILERELGMPVTVENDFTCMARAEHWSGRSRGLETFTLVGFGLSLGCARYRNGTPLYGANGISSELGHTKIDIGDHFRACFCGAHGCVNMYASIYGVLDQIGRSADPDFEDAESLEDEFAQVVSRAAAGDVAIQDVLQRSGAMLGLVVSNLINATDPGNVIVQVPCQEFIDLVSARFYEILDQAVLTGMLANTHVELGVAQNNWRRLGTAALALEHAYVRSNVAA